MSDRLPYLTDEERAIDGQWDGCEEHHRFEMGHFRPGIQRLQRNLNEARKGRDGVQARLDVALETLRWTGQWTPSENRALACCAERAQATTQQIKEMGNE